MNEYDRRQYTLMHDVITNAQLDLISMRYVIDSLSALFSLLQNPDKQWLDKVRQQWWVLEEVYAVALYHNQTHFEKEDAQLIKSTLESIDTDVLEYLT